MGIEQIRMNQTNALPPVPRFNWSQNGVKLRETSGLSPGFRPQVSRFPGFRISVPDGKQERVVDLTGTYLTGAVGFWFGLDPNDVPLLLRDNGSSDIYALTLDRR